MNIGIITGASSGLGLEFYKALQSEALDEIWVIARRGDRLESNAREFGKIKTRIIPMDITECENLRSLDEMLSKEDINIKFLINNAGFGVYGPVDGADFVAQGKMVDLNARALTEITTIALKYMHEKDYIINTCSIASFVPNGNLVVYASTKAYVMSFSRGLRYELKKKKINCLAVCPGPMSTEFLSVAGINDGTSKMFDTLPRANPSKVAQKSVKLVKKGKAVYTPLALFKFYRLLAKILPHSWLLPICKS